MPQHGTAEHFDIGSLYRHYIPIVVHLDHPPALVSDILRPWLMLTASLPFPVNSRSNVEAEVATLAVAIVKKRFCSGMVSGSPLCTSSAARNTNSWCLRRRNHTNTHFHEAGIGFSRRNHAVGMQAHLATAAQGQSMRRQHHGYR